MKPVTLLSIRTCRCACSLLAGVLIAGAHLGVARGQDWVGAVGDWNDPTNWSTGLVPPLFGAPRIGNGGTAQLDSPAATSSLFLGQGTANSGALEVDGDGELALGSLFLLNESSLSITGEGVVSANGNVVNNGSLHIGGNPDSTSIVTVDGLGSSLSSNGLMRVGESGAGTLIIEAGGGVTSPTAVLGRLEGARGRVSVAGDGSTWTIGASTSTALVIGGDGDGVLEIVDGGLVDGGFVDAAGRPETDTGTSTISISGPGSTWSYRATGVDGELSTQAGGEIFISKAGAGSTIIVDGAGSIWTTTGGFGVGRLVALTIRNGGQISAASLGSSAIGDGASVTVTGMGSSWTNGGELFLSGGVLNVLDGASVSSNGGQLGNLLGNAIATISGEGSTWTDTGQFNLGGDFGLHGGEGELRVEAGASFISSGGLQVGGDESGTLHVVDATVTTAGALIDCANLGFGNPDKAATVTIVGPTSTWTDTSDGAVVVGNRCVGRLDIFDGATVTLASRFGLSSINLAARAGSEGTIRIGNGGVAGNLHVAAIGAGSGDAAVIFDHDEPDYVFEPRLGGGLAVHQVGIGTTRLTADYPGLPAVNTYSGPTFVDDGTLILDSDLSGAGDVEVSQAATLRIKGLVGGSTMVAGALVPGVDDETTGLFTFGRNLSFESTATLFMELGGTTPGADFDQLRVNGMATLGGTLELILADDLALELDQQFMILDVGTALSGSFAGLPEGSSVGNVGGIELRITYTGGDGNDVVLFTAPGDPPPEPLVCDANGDGAVDRVDIAAIFAARGTAASGPDDPRDINRDGLITINDGRLCVLQCTNPGCAPSAP